MFNYGNEHTYSLVLTGGRGRDISKIFKSRQAANTEMYSIIRKRKLQIKEIYDDKHDKTYICNGGAEFHINRI